MKVFLGNPPWRQGRKYGIRAGSRWPHFQKLEKKQKVPNYLPFPFFLAYAAAILEKAGEDVLLVDGIGEGLNENEFIEKVLQFQPDIFVTETSAPSFSCDVEVSKKIFTSIENMRIVFAGPHADIMRVGLFKQYPWINTVLVGEYEYTLRDLVLALRDGKSVGGIHGTITNEDNYIVDGGRRPLIEDLNELPWPARHFTPMLNYNDAFCDLPRPNLQMWASRGCPFQCIFCLWPQVMYGGGKYRTRNPVDVVDEMEQVSSEYGMKSVYFDDDTFDIGKERMLKLSSEIKNRNIRLPWGVMARADTLDAETLEAMRNAGLTAIKYGVESSDVKILEASKKNLDLKKLENTLRITRALGIKYHLTFSIGLPGETWDSVRSTIDYAFFLNPDSLQFSIVTPFPGTEYYNIARERGFLETEDWSMFNGAGQAVIRTESMSAKDLEDALCLAQESWLLFNAKRSVFGNYGGKRIQYIKKALRDPKKAIKYLRSYSKGKGKSDISRG